MLPVSVVGGVLGYTGALVVCPVKEVVGRMICSELKQEVVVLAKICEQMYGDVHGVKGWVLRKRQESAGKFALFTNEKKLLVAFQGTCLHGKSWRADLLADGKLLLNLAGALDEENLALLEEVFEAMREFPDQEEIVVTGHSLGGELACLLASKAGEYDEHRRISGHIFNPGASLDLLKMMSTPKLLGCREAKALPRKVGHAG